MVSVPSSNIWMRRPQCPCGDWKCFLTFEGEVETTVVTSGAIKNDFVLSPKVIIAPYVGMVFKRDEDAFEYYCNFARNNGFSIRKERSRMSPQLGVYKRDLVCYRAGFAPARKKQTGEYQRDRKSLRCGCDAKMYLSKVVVDGVSQWFVVQFSNVHNHELLEDDQVRLLPAYRKIHETDQERILLLSKAGFPIHRIVKILELEKGLNGDQLPFLERDIRNFVQNRKKVIQETDALLIEKRENNAMDLLEACRTAKENDAFFDYDVTVDVNDKVENIAWSYGESVQVYPAFGDAVYFDTTYRSITYGMLLGIWLGIDNHGKVILYGCALLQEESPCSFSWALKTFVLFMKGRYPQTIVTDVDLLLRDSIRSELPSTKHVIPMWNILPKTSIWFSPVLGTRYMEFKSEFEAVYNIENEEEFEYQWDRLITRYGLLSDNHVALLFSLRLCWAVCYTRGYFLAQMASISYSKSVDAFLKGILNAQTCLRSFFEQVGISSYCKAQSPEAMQFLHLRTCSPMEEQARRVITPFAFSLLQHELVLAMQYAASEMANGSYIVRHFNKMNGERLVVWIPEDEKIHCSCKEFQSSGILCRHALRVLLVKNYFQLPDKYYLSRWRQEISFLSHGGQSNQTDSDEWFEEYNSLTAILFSEASMTSERFFHMRREFKKELIRLINEVRDMPVKGFAIPPTSSTANGF